MKLLAKFDYKCPGCEIQIDYDNEIPEIHHLDNNPRNNEECNLIPLCHDCHRMVNVGQTVQQVREIRRLFKDAGF